ncbi:ATP-dependent DNA helicase DinG [Alkalihalobacillus xiaoxiensis]|uniref:3'-5' exonuclease DinG n=1 Tax=Shouchella xiaoxiensis TaxID=766895 RepID=A0ABS2T130_9BACI|nr:ATP-dependent DNA helicase DinG [Shouchella xiaoxiensis]
MSQTFVVLDLETTGNSPNQGARIIQIGAVKVEGRKITDRFSTYVDPFCDIPPFIAELTGISNDDVKGAPAFNQVAHELLDFMEGASFFAHNVPFDKGFLKAQLKLEGLDFPHCLQFDTVELSRVLLPKQESYKLSELTSSLNMEHERPHQADSDAEMTAELFLHLLHKLDSLPLITLQSLEQITLKLKSDWEALIHPLKKQKQEKPEADLQSDFDIYRQLALKKPTLEKELKEEVGAPTFNESEDQLLGEDGWLSSVFDTFETRAGQKEMMNQVYQTFEDHAHHLIEAGTGTGKSLGYLIPSAFYAKKTKKPVVISTYSIPLQEQLLQRDLKLLSKILPFQIRMTVLKGRSHYLDLRKFERALTENEEDSYDVCLSKAQILVWLLETDYGDMEELNLSSGGRMFWKAVQSDGVSDLGSYNPWFSRCFYHRSRRNAQNADLIITNHALLLTDVVQKSSIIPTYSHVVVDEAHHLEEAASDHFGQTTNHLSFGFAFSRLTDNTQNSAIKKLEQLLVQKQINYSLSSAVKAIQLAKEDVDELFRMLHVFALTVETGATDVGRISYVYDSFNEQGSLWQGILESAMRIQVAGESVVKELSQACLLVKDSEAMSYLDRSSLADIYTVIGSFEEQVQLVYELLLEQDDQFVYWIEAEPKGAKNATYLYAKPIDVSNQLADQFFAKKKSVVMTSATLTVNHSFAYQIDRLGLEDFGVRTSHIESPFSYESQVTVLIPSDIPNVRGTNDDLYVQDIAIKIWRITEYSKKKALVLFTSYDMLRKVFYYVKDLDADSTLTLIGQGVSSGSRTRLLKMFKQAEQSAILFGTSSFWEGIDLPGNELEHLMIVRLPFAPPNQPLNRAQIERAKEIGQNPFMELSLPQAVIRFKQGFGRLIRTKQDIGTVFVFDRRIVTTRYGHTFLDSLPSVPIYEGKLETLIEQHLYNREEE